MQNILKSAFEQVLVATKNTEPGAIGNDKETLIANAMNFALYELTRDGKIPAGRQQFVPVMGSVIPAWQSFSPMDLPDDFLRIEIVEYISTGYRWRLMDRNDRVVPAPIYGKPTYYQLRAGINDVATGIFGGPVDDLGFSDEIEIFYFQCPTLRTFTEWGAEDTPTPAAGGIGAEVIGELIAKSTHFILTYQNQLEQASSFLAPYMKAMRAASDNQQQN